MPDRYATSHNEDILEGVKDYQSLLTLFLQQKRMLKLVCGLTQAGSWYLYTDSMEGSCDDGAAEILGIDRNKTFNKALFLKCFGEDARNQLDRELTFAIENSHLFTLELEVQFHDQVSKWIKISGYPLIRNDQVVQLEGAIQDVTGLHAALTQTRQQENLFESFFQVIPDLFFLMDFNGTIHDYRAEKSSSLYAPPEMFLNKKLQDILPPELSDLFQKNLEIALFKNEMVPFEYDLPLGEESHHYECRLSLLKDSGKCIAVIRDITERKAQEDALRISEEKYRLLTEFTSDVIWIWNHTRGRYTYISPSVLQLRGYTSEEAMEQTLEESMSPEDFKLTEKEMSRALGDFLKNPEVPANNFAEFLQPCKNGEFVWVEVSVKFRYNSQNEIEMIGVSRNIEERKKSEKEVLFLSYHDQLTGLYNRRFYEEELKRLDIEKNLPITFIMSDVNGLKLTNDAFGHLTGDKLLKAYADILRQECRSEDIIARIGGDEFVVLLPRTDSSRGEIIVNRIISAISKKKLEKALLSVSFGWRTKEDPNEPFDEIYKQAEDFMYRRKLTESTSIKSDILKLITKSLYDKNHVEQQHGEHVSTLCRSIGLALELNPSDLNDLTLAGLLHDVGKIGMSENLLNKPTEFNDSELAEIRRHPEIGYQILRAVNEFADIAEYVLAHHERIDGKGYPKGLKGKDIPLVSKIIAIANAYDVMTGNYSAKVCLSSREAAAVLKTESGKQFDSHIVKVFIQKVLGEEW